MESTFILKRSKEKALEFFCIMDVEFDSTEGAYANSSGTKLRYVCLLFGTKVTGKLVVNVVHI